MDDPSVSHGISKHPTISSVLGVQGPLRIRPHKSTQKAHVVLRRVETSDDSSDESEGNGSSRFVYFSLFAQKRIEVKPGKEILVAVTDGRFKGRPILFTGDSIQSNDNSEEEDKAKSNEDETQSIPFSKHTLPPKMRRAWTKKTDEVLQVPNKPSVVHTSVGVQAVPNTDSTSVQVQPDFKAVAVQSETRTSPASVQTQPSVSSVSVQADPPLPPLQLQTLSHSVGHHVHAAAQTVTRERDRSLSPMELDSPTDEISKSPIPSPSPPESPLFSPTGVPSLIANLNTSSTSDSEDEDMQVSPIDTPPPSLLFLPSNDITASKNQASKTMTEGSLGVTHAHKDTSPVIATKDSSLIPPPFVADTLGAVVDNKSVPKPEKTSKRAPIPNPFVSAGFVTEFTGEARILQENSKVFTASSNTVDAKSLSTNQDCKCLTPPSSDLEVQKKTSSSPALSPTEPKEASSSVPESNIVATPSIDDDRVVQEKVPVKRETEALTLRPADHVKQSETKAVVTTSETQLKTPAPMPRPPSPVRTPKFTATIPTGPRNALASSSRNQLDYIGRQNPPPNAPRAPASLRTMEKAPAGPPPDPRSMAYISSGSYPNSLGIRPSGTGLNTYPSIAPSAPSAPKSLAGVSSTKKRVVIGAGWPHVKPTTEAASSSPSAYNTVSTSQIHAKVKSPELVSYPKSPSPSRTPPPPATQPPAISPQPPPPEPIKIKWKRVDSLSVNTNISPASSTSTGSVLERISPTSSKARKSLPANSKPPEPASLPSPANSLQGPSTSAASSAGQRPPALNDNKQNSLQSSTAPNAVPSAQANSAQKRVAEGFAAPPRGVPSIVASESEAANGRGDNTAHPTLDHPPPPKRPRLDRDDMQPPSLSAPAPRSAPTTDASSSQATNRNVASKQPNSASIPQRSSDSPDTAPANSRTNYLQNRPPSFDNVPPVSTGTAGEATSRMIRTPSGSYSPTAVVPQPASSVSSNAPGSASTTTWIASNMLSGPMSDSTVASMLDGIFGSRSTPDTTRNVVSSTAGGTLTASSSTSIPATPTPSLSAALSSGSLATTASTSYSSIPAVHQPVSVSSNAGSSISNWTASAPSGPPVASVIHGLPSVFYDGLATNILPKNPVSSPSEVALTTSLMNSMSKSTTSLPTHPPSNSLPSNPSIPKVNNGVTSASDSTVFNATAMNRNAPAPISTTQTAAPSTGAMVTPSPTTPGAQLMKHPLPARPTVPPRGVKRERVPSPVNARDTIEPLRRRKRVFKWPTLESNHSIVLRGEGDLSIMGLAFSSDGVYLALNCADKTIRIWNNQTRTEMARLSHNARVVTVMWIEGDGGVVSLGEDGLVSKWTRTGFNHWQWAKVVDTGTEPSTPGEEGGMCLAYKKDRIAVSFPRTGVKVWIWTKGSWQAQRPIARQNVTALTFIEDGAALLGGTLDGVLWSCQVPNGTLRACAFVKAKITWIEINPAKTHALVTHVGGVARLVSLQPEKKGHAEQSYSNKETLGRPQCGFGAIFAAQGQGVLFGDVTGCALVWDTRKGSLVYGLDHGEGERGEDEVIRSAAGYESASGGGCLVTGTKSGLLSWWSQPAYTNPNSEESNKRARAV